MKIKQITSLMILLALLFSCKKQDFYEDAKNPQLKITITNQSGIPLENVLISLYEYENGEQGAEFKDKSGNTAFTTDKNGEVTIYDMEEKIYFINIYVERSDGRYFLVNFDEAHRLKEPLQREKRVCVTIKIDE